MICLYVILVMSHFGFEGKALVLIATVPGHCLPFNFLCFGVILTKCFRVGVSCRNLFSFVVYLYVNGSGSTTSVREERASLTTVIYL